MVLVIAVAVVSEPGEGRVRVGGAMGLGGTLTACDEEACFAD